MHLKMIQNKTLLLFGVTALLIVRPVMPALSTNLVKILTNHFSCLNPK